MKDADRQLLRLFYQSIPAQEEKDAFYVVLSQSKETRLKYLAELIGKNIPVTPEIQAALLASSFTKEDRIAITAGFARTLIFKILSFFGF